MLTFDDLHLNVEEVSHDRLRITARCPLTVSVELDKRLMEREVRPDESAIAEAKMAAKAALMRKLYGEQGVMLDRLEAAHHVVVEAQVQLAHSNYSYYERDAQALRDAEFLYSQAVLNMRHEIQGD